MGGVLQGLEQKREQMQVGHGLSALLIPFVSIPMAESSSKSILVEAQWEMERKQFITHIACCRAGSTVLAVVCFPFTSL